MNLSELNHVTGDLKHSPRMPVVFVGHGSPMNAIEENAFTGSLKKLGSGLARENEPEAILVVSAHWLTRGTFVHKGTKPETIHDFGGFPEELYRIQYPAPGSPLFAGITAGLDKRIQETEEWGLDHGAWTILSHMFPSAKIPVYQVSIDYHKPMDYHYELGKELASLRDKGVLIIGSGNIVHNLRMSLVNMGKPDTPPYDWAIDFDLWVKDRIGNRDFRSLVDYEITGIPGRLSVPTPDHYIPLLYCLGVMEPKEPIAQVYEGLELGGISMRTFRAG